MVIAPVPLTATDPPVSSLSRFTPRFSASVAYGLIVGIAGVTVAGIRKGVSGPASTGLEGVATVSIEGTTGFAGLSTVEFGLGIVELGRGVVEPGCCILVAGALDVGPGPVDSGLGVLEDIGEARVREEFVVGVGKGAWIGGAFGAEVARTAWVWPWNCNFCRRLSSFFKCVEYQSGVR